MNAAVSPLSTHRQRQATTVLLMLQPWASIGATVAAIAAGLLLVLVLAFWTSWRRGTLMSNVAFFFALSVAYLVILVVLAWMYIANYYGIKTAVAWLIGGILPIGVPWFGALGATLISLQGVFDHNTHWDPSYGHWHIARPLVGAVVGTVAYFVYLLLIKVTGEDAPTSTEPVIDLIPFYVVAFLVGYREETFRNLIKAVTDLLLKPAGVTTTRGPAVAFEIGGVRRQGSHDLGQHLVNGPPVVVAITVYNLGEISIAHALALLEPASPPGTSAFVRNGNDLRGEEFVVGASKRVDVTFAPPRPGSYSAVMKITSEGRLTGMLMLTGTAQ
jgi:hypothetical protein